MGYDATEDTYATSCDEFSDSETELSTVEQLLRGYEPPLLVLDGSDHALFAQIDLLITSIHQAKLLQHVRISSSFLQGLIDMDTVDCMDASVQDITNSLQQAQELFSAIASLASVSLESFTCHWHPKLPRHELVTCQGLLDICHKVPKLTLNNFVLTPDLIQALGENAKLTELRAYFDATNHHERRQERRRRQRSSKTQLVVQEDPAKNAHVEQQEATTPHTPPSAPSLDPLFRALASNTSSQLHTLDVYDKHDERPEQERQVTPSALQALLHNHPALQDLKLWHLDTPQVVAVAQALTTTTTESSCSSKLQTLTIGSSFLTHEAYVALADMLSTGGGSLHHLFLSDIASCESCLLMCTSLQSNTSLQSLELTYDAGGEELGAAVLDLLQNHNTTLMHFKLFTSYSMDNDDSALLLEECAIHNKDVSQSNRSSTSDTGILDWEAQVQALLEQNKAGTR